MSLAQNTNPAEFIMKITHAAGQDGSGEFSKMLARMYKKSSFARTKRLRLQVGLY